MPMVEVVMPKMGESITEATILKWHKQAGDVVKQDETILDIATDKVDTEVPSPVAGTLEELFCKVNDVVAVGTVIAKISTAVEADLPPAGNLSGTAAGKMDTIPDEHATDTTYVSSNGTLNITTKEQSAIYSAEKDKSSEPRDAGTGAWAGPDPGNGRDNRNIHNGVVSKDAGRNTVSLNGSPNRFYSPLVLNIAGNEGVALHELETIPGTGNDGRVTKKDILHYIGIRKQPRLDGNGYSADAGGIPEDNILRAEEGKNDRAENAAEQPAQTTNRTSAQPETSGADNTTKQSVATGPAGSEIPAYSGSVQIIEMDRMRRLIADHMVRSKQTSPHVTSFSEADVTNLVQWREKEKAAFEKREGTKLTLTPLFIEAIVRCIKRFPMINSSLQGTSIIIKKDINIGMATALPSGNLIVPVIKNADNYNLVGLARQVNQLAASARENKLKPQDIQDGTFTLTNLGLFGSLMGVPIINQPQSAILAIGAIKKRPVVIETDQGDSIGIRQMMYLSMSYDHRIIDGALGASFLTAVAKELEAFAP